MVGRLIVVSGVLLLLILSCQKNQRHDAVHFNNEVTTCIDSAAGKMVDFELSIYAPQNGEAEKAYRQLDSVLRSCRRSLQEYKQFSTSDPEFYTAAENIVTLYTTILKSDYKSVLEKVKRQELSEQEEERVEDQINKTYVKEDSLIARFHRAQNQFASKYQLKVEEEK